MKVSIYTGNYPAATFVQRLIDQLAATNTEVIVIGSGKKDNKKRNYKVRVINTGRIQRVVQLLVRIIQLAFSSRAKFKFIISDLFTNRSVDQSARYAAVLVDSPDVFHIQWSKAINDWIFLQEKFNVSLVLSLRGAHINYSPLANQKLEDQYRKHFPKIKAAHAVSNDIASRASEYGLNKEVIKVIRTGIPGDFLRSEKHESRSIPGQGAIKLLSVGRPHWKKGYDVAFRAIKNLKSNGIEISYTIVAGELNEELEFLSNDLGIKNELNFIPRVAPDDLKKYYDQADIFLLPSVEEGIANVAVEAMARKCIVLSSNCTGMPELIEDRTTGFLFESYNDTDLADKILQIVQFKGDELNKIREAAFNLVKDYYLVDHLGEEMNEVYKLAITENS